ncbi:hypothetical protein B296_00022706, partial [Ensete ventricosum]
VYNSEIYLHLSTLSVIQIHQIWSPLCRDGVSDGQFDQACPSTEPNYQQPKTSVVVQKRHRTRLFANNHSNRCSVDTIGNILPG